MYFYVFCTCSFSYFSPSLSPPPSLSFSPSLPLFLPLPSSPFNHFPPHKIRCFDAPLQPNALRDVKNIVQRNTETGVASDGVTLEGVTQSLVAYQAGLYIRACAAGRDIFLLCRISVFEQVVYPARSSRNDLEGAAQVWLLELTHPQSPVPAASVRVTHTHTHTHTHVHTHTNMHKHTHTHTHIHMHTCTHTHTHTCIHVHA